MKRSLAAEKGARLAGGIAGRQVGLRSASAAINCSAIGDANNFSRLNKAVVVGT